MVYNSKRDRTPIIFKVARLSRFNRVELAYQVLGGASQQGASQAGRTPGRAHVCAPLRYG
ncbi:hypothetical protein [Coleofasciculus sp. F4-SAH-05]|uniref:hypothetical protein n=1 Tax=Coleofasciculus sp. F4-SAH-05 TaxID=3069525 RepID=UPI003305407B